MCNNNGWSSIDTAPKDGTLLLLCEGNARCIGRFYETVDRWSDTDDILDETRARRVLGDAYGDYRHAIYPTHWQPLPDAPKP